MGKVPVSAQKNTSAAKLLYALPLLVVCAVFLLAPAFFSALCTKASCDWVSGWSAWKRGDAAAALGRQAMCKGAKRDGHGPPCAQVGAATAL